jgi:hypothetical protein
VPFQASAQDSDAKRAEALFLEGRAALERGDAPLACAKFSESLKLVNRASTLLNLAQCEEAQGKLADALRHTKEAMDLLEPSDQRRAIAVSRHEALEKRVARLTIKIAPSAPPDARVVIDGAAVEPSELGSPLAVDPGEHEIALSAAGKLEQRVTVRLKEAEQKALALSFTAASSSDQGGGGGAGRAIGLIVGGVGLASIIAGSITGGLVLSKKSTVEENCDLENDTCSNQAGVDAADAGRTLSTISTITFAVGAAGLGAGLILVLTSGGGESGGGAPSVALIPSASPLGGGVRLVGTF